MTTAAELISRIIGDFGSSFWLRKAVWTLMKRDPVDALNDVEALLEIQKKRVGEAVTGDLDAYSEG